MTAAIGPLRRSWPVRSVYLSKAAPKRASKLGEVVVAFAVEDMSIREMTVARCGRKVEGREGDFWRSLTQYSFTVTGQCPARVTGLAAVVEPVSSWDIKYSPETFRAFFWDKLCESTSYFCHLTAVYLVGWVTGCADTCAHGAVTVSDTRKLS